MDLQSISQQNNFTTFAFASAILDLILASTADQEVFTSYLRDFSNALSYNDNIDA
jgi:hypothetical protein